MTKQLSTQIMYKNPWMRVREDQVEFANGHQGIYGVVEKDPFALIIPYDGTHLHLVKQFRYPTQQDSIEFPQGKHENEPNTDPTILANIELKEELGLSAEQIIQVGFLHEAPGYSTQGIYIFFATGLSEGKNNPDPTEADLVHLQFTPSEFEAAVEAGKITDTPTVAAYGIAKMRKLI